MPCWTIQTTSIKFGEKTDVSALADAIRAMGGNVWSQTSKSLDFALDRSLRGTFRNGILQASGATKLDHAWVKRAYAEQVLRKAAKKKGWTVKRVKGKKHIFAVIKG